MAARPAARLADRHAERRPGRSARPVRTKSRAISFASPHGQTCQSGLSPVGLADSFPMDERMADSGSTLSGQPLFGPGKNWYLYLIVLLFAGAIYVGCIVSPPSLMDDVDSVQAQIARNMLVSGDWVTARLDGVPYLEKAPLIYWMMAWSYRLFGVHDWAARLPLALAVVLLCWFTYRFARWAFDEEAGLFAGLALATCVGLFLFTRILIPDATLTLSITAAIWAWLRLLEPEMELERKSRLRWSVILGASLGVGLLLK